MLQNVTLLAILAIHTEENELPLPATPPWVKYTALVTRRRRRHRRRAILRLCSLRHLPTLRWILFITWRTFGGSFAAVWIATIASKVTFYSIFQALQDKQTFAPFTFQNFSEKTSKFLPEWKWNFIFHSRFSMNFAIFRRNFNEN